MRIFVVPVSPGYVKTIKETGEDYTFVMPNIQSAYDVIESNGDTPVLVGSEDEARQQIAGGDVSPVTIAAVGALLYFLLR